MALAWHETLSQIKDRAGKFKIDKLKSQKMRPQDQIQAWRSMPSQVFFILGLVLGLDWHTQKIYIYVWQIRTKISCLGPNLVVTMNLT